MNVFWIVIINSWRCIQQTSLNMPLPSTPAIYFSELAQEVSMWSHISLDPTLITLKWGSSSHPPITTINQDGLWLERDNGKFIAHLFLWIRFSQVVSRDRWPMLNWLNLIKILLSVRTENSLLMMNL